MSTEAQFQSAVKAYERCVINAAAKLSKTNCPIRKAHIMSNLALHQLRDLEDWRPGGGFMEMKK